MSEFVKVYEAATGIDAHMIANFLQQRGIAARVEGEYLQGGIGELQAMNIVRVMVKQPDQQMARTVIAQWEATPVRSESQARPSGLLAGAGSGLIIGLLAGLIIMYLLYNG